MQMDATNRLDTGDYATLGLPENVSVFQGISKKSCQIRKRKYKLFTHFTNS